MEVVRDFLQMFWDVCGCIARSIMRWVVRPPEKDVADRICLVTGAAGGMGRRFALEFARKGATVILWDIDAAGNEETAREVRRLGVRAYPYTCDMSQRRDIYAVAGRVRQEVGDVSILIHNAGATAGDQFLQSEDEDLEKRVRSHYANFWMVKSFLPRMIEMNNGHVVTVSSYLGLIAAASQEDYCTAQFAAVGLHESLSHTLKAGNIDGVKTTLICPYVSNPESAHVSHIRRELRTWLSPVTEEGCVRTAMRGILSDQTMVCTPRLLYLAALLKHLVPWEVQLLCYKFLSGEERPVTAARSSIISPIQ